MTSCCYPSWHCARFCMSVVNDCFDKANIFWESEFCFFCCGVLSVRLCLLGFLSFYICVNRVVIILRSSFICKRFQCFSITDLKSGNYLWKCHTYLNVKSAKYNTLIRPRIRLNNHSQGENHPTFQYQPCVQLRSQD